MKQSIKRRIAGISLATMLAVSSLASASAATAKYNFTKAGNVYGITTQATGFSKYVTTWAKVSNNGKTVSAKSTGYKSSKATAKKTCTSVQLQETAVLFINTNILDPKSANS